MSVYRVQPDGINLFTVCGQMDLIVFECLDKRGRVRLCNIVRQFDGLELWVLLYEMMHIKADITLHSRP